MSHKKNKLLNRSGLRRCEICSVSGILVAHHILGREILNANHRSNLVNICPNCHCLIHEGKIIIEKWVVGTTGKFLAWHYVGEDGITGQDSHPYKIGEKK
jgi:hypothetical protein